MPPRSKLPDVAKRVSYPVAIAELMARDPYSQNCALRLEQPPLLLARMKCEQIRSPSSNKTYLTNTVAR